MASLAFSEMTGLKLMKYFPCDSSSFGDETYSPENQTSPGHTVPFDHHAGNRQSSSFPDEAPTDIPAYIISVSFEP